MATEGIFALRFCTQAAYDAFADSYREKLFENTFKVENDETNRDKVALTQLGAFGVSAPEAPAAQNVAFDVHATAFARRATVLELSTIECAG